MSFDPPFDLPPSGVPAWALDLYDWLALVQDQVDQHAAQLGRNGSAIAQLRGKLMSQQDEINQVVAQEQAADQRISNLASDLRSQIASLQAQVDAGNATLDLSGLHAVADQLDAVAPADQA